MRVLTFREFLIHWSNNQISISWPFIDNMIQAKKAMTGEVGEKPAMVKTHLRDVVVVPEMVGSVIGIYNGKGMCFIFYES